MKKTATRSSVRPDRVLLARYDTEKAAHRSETETVPEYFTLFLLQELLSSIGLRHKH